MKYLTVTPAYGRDYTTAKAALADWKAGKDFIVRDISDPYDGKPINLQDACALAPVTINIRYKRLAGVTSVKVNP